MAEIPEEDEPEGDPFAALDRLNEEPDEDEGEPGAPGLSAFVGRRASASSRRPPPPRAPRLEDARKAYARAKREFAMGRLSRADLNAMAAGLRRLERAAPAGQAVTGPDISPNALDRGIAGGASLLPQGIIDRLAAVRPTGSLFPLVAALLILLFALVPANAAGDTRLVLIWKALTGGVQLPASAKRVALLEARGQAQSDANVVGTAASDLQAAEALGAAGWDVFWGQLGL